MLSAVKLTTATTSAVSRVPKFFEVQRQRDAAEIDLTIFTARL